MIKPLLFTSLILASAPSFAMDILNPLYTPSENTLVSKTSLTTKKERYKNEYGYNKTFYKTTAMQELQYGITNNIALIGSISNIWQKDNALNDDIFTTEDKNIDFTIGALYNFTTSTSAPQIQIAAQYAQSESWADTGTGGYKYILASIKAGYQLGATMPYFLADIELPVAQSKYGHNHNRYLTTAGVHQLIHDKISLDIALNFNYESEWKQGALTGAAAIGYAFTPTTGLSVYGTFPIDSHQQLNGQSWSRTLGIKLTTQF